MQIWLGKHQHGVFGTGGEEIFWWRTYSPPIWLLDGTSLDPGTTGLKTRDLMGIPPSALNHKLLAALDDCTQNPNRTVGLVAPWSSTELDSWRDINVKRSRQLEFEEVWRWERHLNLDDLDVGGEGVWGTLARVVGRRGLVVWRVGRRCQI